MGGGGADPSWHLARGCLHSGHVNSQSQGRNVKQHKNNPHLILHTTQSHSYFTTASTPLMEVMRSLPFQFISCFVATDTVGSNREVSQMGKPVVKPGAQHTTERKREGNTASPSHNLLPFYKRPSAPGRSARGKWDLKVVYCQQIRWEKRDYFGECS